MLGRRLQQSGFKRGQLWITQVEAEEEAEAAAEGSKVFNTNANSVTQCAKGVTI